MRFHRAAKPTDGLAHPPHMASEASWPSSPSQSYRPSSRGGDVARARAGGGWYASCVRMASVGTDHYTASPQGTTRRARPVPDELPWCLRDQLRRIDLILCRAVMTARASSVRGAPASPPHEPGAVLRVGNLHVGTGSGRAVAILQPGHLRPSRPVPCATARPLGPYHAAVHHPRRHVQRVKLAFPRGLQPSLA